MFPNHPLPSIFMPATLPILNVAPSAQTQFEALPPLPLLYPLHCPEPVLEKLKCH